MFTRSRRPFRVGSSMATTIPYDILQLEMDRHNLSTLEELRNKLKVVWTFDSTGRYVVTFNNSN